MRLSNAQRAGYAVGDMGINFYFASAMTYLLFFYTDVYGLDAAVAASVFLVARIVDAVTDPLMGWIADRTKTRWGKFRPYLMLGALPLALVSIATFTVPAFSEHGKVMWAYATYVTFGLVYTVVAIPYAAMTAALTDDYQERTTLSTFRMLAAFLGAYVVSAETMRVVALFDDQAAGFQGAMVLYSIIATMLLALTFGLSRERPALVSAPPPSLRQSITTIAGNWPLLVVIVVFMCGMMSFTVRQTATLYYFKYNLGRGDLVPLYFEITFPLMMVALFIVPWLGERFSKAGAVMVGAVVTIIGAVGLYLTPYDQVFWVFVFASVMAVGGSPIAVLGWAMIADTVDYAEWRTGVRADGFIYATASLFQKIAKAVGGAGVAMMLAWFGYVANAEQSAESLDAIRAAMTLVPIAIMLVLIATVSFYKLDARQHRRLLDELQARTAPSTTPNS